MKTSNCVTPWLLALSLLLLLLLLLSHTLVALSAPMLASHSLDVHPTMTDRLSRFPMRSSQRSSRGRRALNTRRSFITPSTSASEVNALLAFRSSIQTDPTRALANWTRENNSTHCSTWQGVACDEVGQVIGVDLPELKFNGTINGTIGDLNHLAFLNLSWSSLWGPIPTELARCQSLSILDLSHNSLDGEVVPELFTISKLESLSLSYNRFSGSLPEVPEYGCRSLTDLELSNTDISGAIPSSLSRCQNLTVLSLTNNQLNGTIPATLGELHQLQGLQLANNKLTGSIPSNCENLTHLILRNNRLNGSIPTTLGELHQLQELWLDNNTLTGEIPSQLGSLQNLVKLVLYGNKLTGTIPPSLGMLSQLQVLALHDNKLTGSIPPFLGNCSSLTDLYLGSTGTKEEYNNFTGIIPEEYGNLSNLVLLSLMFNKHLSGPVPGFLSKCLHLKWLYLPFCNFTSIAPKVWSMESLQILALSSNSVSGELPSEVGNCTNLAWLDLRDNNLSGSIPLGLGNLRNVQIIDLSSNELTSTIPYDLGMCTSLKALDISSNYLTGDIPESLGNLSSLIILDLTGNNLTSSAAAISTLNQCTQLITLRLGENRIYGPLQLDFTKWASMKHFSIPNNKLTGGIPPSLGGINSSLIVLDFSHNGLTGGFPTQVDSAHLSSLHVLMLSNNQLEGTIPSWLGDLESLQVLDLSHNKLSGSLPQNFGSLDGFKVESNGNAIESGAVFTFSQSLNLIYVGRNFTVVYDYILTNTTISMDLSSNALEGEIPKGIANLVGLKKLVLSNNKFEGEIWPAVQDLKVLETLDLSQNNLSGPIPSTLSSSVNRYNVSFNNLSGVIPSGNQFDTFTDISWYLPGNEGLCGAVIHRMCVGDVIEDQGFEISDYLSIPSFGIGAAIGFFIVVVTSLAWAPARHFVIGAANKRKARAAGQSAYGLFNPRFEMHAK